MNQEIKNEAIAVFEQYPLAKVVFITPDLQGFLREDRARMHNKDFTTVKRSEVLKESEGTGEKMTGIPANADGSVNTLTNKPTKKTAEELIAFAATAETIEELDAIIQAGEKRATVLAAFAARKAELTPKQD